MEQLRNSRSGHLGTVTRTLNSIAAIIAKNPKNINYEEVGKLEFALERCEGQEAKIWELDEQIIAKMMENNIETEKIEQENENIDDSRFKNGSSIKTIKRLLARYESHNQSSSDSEDRNQVSSRNGLKLPKLNLPIFSGKYSNWTSFIDLFDGTVDKNSSITDVQKLQYLKSSLKGDPAKLLANLPITNGNYSIAKQMLKDTYGNRRMISHVHIEAIVEFPPVKKECPEQLRKLLTNFMEKIMALQALGHDTDSSDNFWIYTIAKKFDSETRKQWELYSPGDEFQTVTDLKTFLEERIRAFEASKRTTKLSDRTIDDDQIHNANVYHSSNSSSCPCCEQDHPIYQCSKFKQFSVAERRNLVRVKKLCFNCLRSGHNSRNCKSNKRCLSCKKSHHSLLHDANQ